MKTGKIMIKLSNMVFHKYLHNIFTVIHKHRQVNGTLYRFRKFQFNYIPSSMRDITKANRQAKFHELGVVYAYAYFGELARDLNKYKWGIISERKSEPKVTCISEFRKTE